MCYVYKQPKYAPWIQNVLNQISTACSEWSSMDRQKHKVVTVLSASET